MSMLITVKARLEPWTFHVFVLPHVDPNSPALNGLGCNLAKQVDKGRVQIKSETNKGVDRIRIKKRKKRQDLEGI